MAADSLTSYQPPKSMSGYLVRFAEGEDGNDHITPVRSFEQPVGFATGAIGLELYKIAIGLIDD